MLNNQETKQLKAAVANTKAKTFKELLEKLHKGFGFAKEEIAAEIQASGRFVKIKQVLVPAPKYQLKSCAVKSSKLEDVKEAGELIDFLVSLGAKRNLGVRLHNHTSQGFEEVRSYQNWNYIGCDHDLETAVRDQSSQFDKIFSSVEELKEYLLVAPTKNATKKPVVSKPKKIAATSSTLTFDYGSSLFVVRGIQSLKVVGVDGKRQVIYSAKRENNRGKIEEQVTFNVPKDLEVLTFFNAQTGIYQSIAFEETFYVHSVVHKEENSVLVL
jgi:hypothetical protein